MYNFKWNSVLIWANLWSAQGCIRNVAKLLRIKIQNYPLLWHRELFKDYFWCIYEPLRCIFVSLACIHHSIVVILFHKIFNESTKWVMFVPWHQTSPFLDRQFVWNHFVSTRKHISVKREHVLYKYDLKKPTAVILIGSHESWIVNTERPREL